MRPEPNQLFNWTMARRWVFCRGVVLTIHSARCRHTATSAALVRRIVHTLRCCMGFIASPPYPGGLHTLHGVCPPRLASSSETGILLLRK